MIQDIELRYPNLWWWSQESLMQALHITCNSDSPCFVSFNFVRSDDHTSNISPHYTFNRYLLNSCISVGPWSPKYPQIPARIIWVNVLCTIDNIHPMGTTAWSLPHLTAEETQTIFQSPTSARAQVSTTTEMSPMFLNHQHLQLTTAQKSFSVTESQTSSTAQMSSSVTQPHDIFNIFQCHWNTFIAIFNTSSVTESQIPSMSSCPF